MRTYHFILRTLMSLFLLPWLMYGCINEDTPRYSASEKEVLLGFTFNPNNDDDLDPSDLSVIEVFVFDEADVYIGSYVDNNPQMQNRDYRIALPLKPGKYSFTAWGNIGNEYGYTPTQPLIKGVTTRSSASLSFARPTNDTITTMVNHLFYGNLQKSDIRQQRLMIPLVQNTYTINLEILGLPPSLPPCFVVITDNKSDYDFINNGTSSKDINYISRCIGWGGFQQASLRTLRLTAESSQTRLKLYDDDSNLLYDASLLNLIQASNNNGTSVDFDRTHTYNIGLEIKLSPIGFTVTVEDWYTHTQSSGINL